MYILLAGFLLLTAAVARAQQPVVNSRFSEWDKDNNQKLTHAEFYEGMKATGLFERWDRNGDSLLDRQEVYAGRQRMQQLQLRERAQRERSADAAAGPASSASLQEGGFSFQYKPLGDADFAFREVDLNRDGTLDRTEFFTALFRLWDKEKNGFLRSHELKEARLNQWELK